MSWFFISTEDDEWSFIINADHVQAYMRFIKGGFRKGYKLYSIGEDQNNRSYIELDFEEQSLKITSKKQGLFPEIQLNINLPDQSFQTLRTYIEAIPDKNYDPDHEFNNNNDENNQLFEDDYDHEQDEPEPIEPIALPEPIGLPEPIALAEIRNFEYNNAPNARNIIMMEDKKINEIDNTHIVFKHGPSFFYYEKENIDIEDHSRWVFKCHGLLPGGTPRRDQIHEDTIYYNLSGPNMNYIVQLSQLRAALNHPDHTFELVQTGQLDHTVSYNAVIANPAMGTGLDGQPVNIIGLYHCQDGSNQPLFAIHSLHAHQRVQEGAGKRRRRTLRKRRHNRRTTRSVI